MNQGPELNKSHYVEGALALGSIAALGVLICGWAWASSQGNETIPAPGYNTFNENNVPEQQGVVFNPDADQKPFGGMTVTIPSPVAR